MKKTFTRFRISFLVFMAMLTTVNSAFAYDAVVAKDGSGNYTTVKDAINAAPSGRVAAWVIFIKNGTYYEKDTVPSAKPFLQLVGESVNGTIITFDAGASAPSPLGGTYGTQGSASFTINAANFSALNITFQNSYGDGSQAVAVVVNADMASFCNCRFLGNQDTLYTKGSGTPRHYFKNCYIDGNVDFIFGSSAAIFDSCVIYAKSRVSGGSSYITAASTPPGQRYGYVFRNCKLTANTGATTYYLGRPWQNSTGSSPLANNKVVFINAAMNAYVRPEGWAIWDAGTDVSLIMDAEYNSHYFNGIPLDVSSRVPWSHQLDAAALDTFKTTDIFGAWDPEAVFAGACGVTELSVSNLQGTKGASNSTITWNISWPVSSVNYELFRSVDNAPFGSLGSLTAADDSSVNFSLTDVIPPAGSIYYYYVVATKVGYNTSVSDTIQISSKPTITVSSSAITGIVQNIGFPQTAKTYNVSGVNLLSNVTITPPVPFEVSADNGNSWFTNASPLVLAPSGTTLTSTTIGVRLNAAVAGPYSGDIVHTATQADVVNVAVSGNATTDPPLVSNVLQYWPLIADNNDDPAQRDADIVASSPILHNLYLSNGTAVPAIAAYSTQFGQALGAGATGDGTWGTGIGGPGGNLTRVHYEEFTITPGNGNPLNLRVDSIILTTAFYNTSSNTKMAVVYSKSGFVSDSADVTGGTGPAGSLASSANGAFATPIIVANQTGGPVNVYRLALNDAAGVSDGISPITIRIYYACGSGSAGRYAMLKNVAVKGLVIDGLPLKLLSFTGVYNAGKTKLSWSTTNEVDVSRFELEKSTDGRSFAALTTIAAKGVSGNNSYSTNDNNVTGKLVYYRLRMIDKDGKFSFSNTVSVHISKSSVIIVRPNPASGKITVVHDEARGKANIKIYGADGKQVVVLSIADGTFQTTVDISKLPKGSYSVIMDNEGIKSTARFVKM